MPQPPDARHVFGLLKSREPVKGGEQGEADCLTACQPRGCSREGLELYILRAPAPNLRMETIESFGNQRRRRRNRAGRQISTVHDMSHNSFLGPTGTREIDWFVVCFATHRGEEAKPHTISHQEAKTAGISTFLCLKDRSLFHGTAQQM